MYYTTKYEWLGTFSCKFCESACRYFTLVKHNTRVADILNSEVSVTPKLDIHHNFVLFDCPSSLCVSLPFCLWFSWQPAHSFCPFLYDAFAHDDYMNTYMSMSAFTISCAVWFQNEIITKVFLMHAEAFRQYLLNRQVLRMRRSKQEAAQCLPLTLRRKTNLTCIVAFES